MNTKQYEINGAEENALYTITNDGKIDETDTIRYNTLSEAKKILRANLDKYIAVVIYEWKDDEITDVHIIKYIVSEGE